MTETGSRRRDRHRDRRDVGARDRSFQVTGSSNEAVSPGPDVVITPTGAGFGLQLRADRDGGGSGRIYSLTATATDRAGNAATVPASCVVPHEHGRN